MDTPKNNIMPLPGDGKKPNRTKWVVAVTIVVLAVVAVGIVVGRNHILSPQQQDITAYGRPTIISTYDKAKNMQIIDNILQGTDYSKYCTKLYTEQLYPQASVDAIVCEVKDTMAYYRNDNQQYDEIVDWLMSVFIAKNPNRDVAIIPAPEAEKASVNARVMYDKSYKGVSFIQGQDLVINSGSPSFQQNRLQLNPFVDFTMDFSVKPKVSFAEIKAKYNGRVINEVDGSSCHHKTTIALNDNYQLLIQVGNNDDGTEGYFLLYTDTFNDFTVTFDATSGEIIGYTYLCPHGGV